MYLFTTVSQNFDNFFLTKSKCINNRILHRKYRSCNIRNAFIIVQMWMYNIYKISNTI